MLQYTNTQIRGYILWLCIVFECTYCIVFEFMHCNESSWRVAFQCMYYRVLHLSVFRVYVFKVCCALYLSLYIVIRVRGVLHFSV